MAEAETSDPLRAALCTAWRLYVDAVPGALEHSPAQRPR